MLLVDVFFIVHRRILLSRSKKKPGRYVLNSVRALLSFGAGEMNRTPDLLITNELLYRLSYTG